MSILPLMDRTVWETEASLTWETIIHPNMPKTTGVAVNKQTEENPYGEMTVPLPMDREWVRENPSKDKVIRHNRHKVSGKVDLPKIRAVLPTTPKWIKAIEVDRNKATMVRKAVEKVDLPKIKAVLPTTPKWIRVIGVDRNKATMVRKAVEKVDLKKIRVDPLKTRGNLQWTVRWQMTRDHRRCPPKENRTRGNPKVEENRKIHFPVHQDRMTPQGNLSLHPRRMFKWPKLKRVVAKANQKAPVIHPGKIEKNLIKNQLRAWHPWNRSLSVSQTKLNKRTLRLLKWNGGVAKAIPGVPVKPTK
jgi:hypothetical protein